MEPGDPSRAPLLPPGWWGERHLPPQPRSVARLVSDRVLDAELAALTWLLVEAHVPVIVAGPPGSGRTTVLTALLDFLPADARMVPLEGAIEDFGWLPEATELGWRHERPMERRTDALAVTRPVSRASTVLLVAELGAVARYGTWGPRARVAVRALALGYAMAATMAARRLEDVLDGLKAPPVRADDDELTRLGLVLVLRAVEPVADGEPRPRVAAAHYVRPVVRDAHGHVQRMPPAVLAAHDAATDRFEHFAWGIVTELASRTGRTPLEFEREQARRAQYLAGLASAGITEPGAVRTAIAGYRGAAGGAIPV